MNALRRLLLPLPLLVLAACGDDSGDPVDTGGADVADAATDTSNDATDAAPDADVTDTPEPDAADAVDVADVEPDADVEPLPPLGERFDRCDTPAMTPSCFARLRDPDSELMGLARAIAYAVIDTTDPRTIRWDWSEAVMLFGMMRVAAITGDTPIVDFVAEYLDHHIAAGYEITTSDRSAPASLAVALIAAGRDEERYRQVVADALHYYAVEAARTPDGGLSHFGTLELLGVELWADSLFMFGSVMTPWGAATNDVALLDTYAEQLGIFAAAMQDDSGLFRHAAYSSFPQEDDVFWARANGWVLAAGNEHASVRIQRGLPVDDHRRITRDLAQALIPLQDPATGLWSTVVNRPGETYLETSASALFAYGLARAWRYGMADDTVLDVIDRATEGVLSQIRFDRARRPIIGGISGPTSVGDFLYYAQIPVGDDIPHGVGAVLLALTEISGLGLDIGVPVPALDPVAEPAGDVVPIEPSAAFEARRAEFLAWCAENNAPGMGGIYGQSCRVAVGLEVNEVPINSAIQHINERRDVSDFRANALVRLLYLDDATDALGEEVRGRIEECLLGFKYWLDEPGDDGMAYWTENHQILFHTVELLMGQRFPDTVFTNSGNPGSWHAEHARDRIERWLRLRGRYGFSEWHSSVYFNEDLPALLNLVDFAEDEELRTLATMVLDVMAIDLATNMFDGAFATTAGRIYQGHFIGGENESTREFAWIALGLAGYRSADNFAGAFLATSTYVIPPVLEDLAAEAEPTLEHRQRDSWDVEERAAVGVTTEGLDDTVVWAGLSAIVAPAVIDGSMAVFNEYDLWDGFLFGSLPNEVLSLLRSLVGTPGLRQLAMDLHPLARGMALEGVDTYVFRTPDYQLAAAQDWKPGMWAAQTLMFRAALGRDVAITMNVPTALGLASPSGVTIDDPWIGGWLPRVTAHRNVAVLQFFRPAYDALVDTVVQGEIVHAYFPTERFDEWEQRGSWWLGRLGDGYVALWSQHPATLSDEQSWELIVDGLDNVFVLELGRAADFGSFEAFADAITAAVVETTPLPNGAQRVTYESPGVGTVDVGWVGPMFVDGERVDLGPYQRFESPVVEQSHATDRLVARSGGRSLVLDFGGLRREMLAP